MLVLPDRNLCLDRVDEVPADGERLCPVRGGDDRDQCDVADLEVPEVPEFLELLSASGAQMWGCQMSADMMGLTMDDLYEGVDGIINASDFIEKSEGAQLLFI